MQNNCPHRGASLFFGRNEEDGLRCVYHGWKFDGRRQLRRHAERARRVRLQDTRCTADGLSDARSAAASCGPTWARDQAAAAAGLRVRTCADDAAASSTPVSGVQLAAGARGRHRHRRTPASCTAASKPEAATARLSHSTCSGSHRALRDRRHGLGVAVRRLPRRPTQDRRTGASRSSCSPSTSMPAGGWPGHEVPRICACRSTTSTRCPSSWRRGPASAAGPAFGNPVLPNTTDWHGRFRTKAHLRTTIS